jgi:hypothetical protein
MSTGRCDSIFLSERTAARSAAVTETGLQQEGGRYRKRAAAEAAIVTDSGGQQRRRPLQKAGGSIGCGRCIKRGGGSTGGLYGNRAVQLAAITGSKRPLQAAITRSVRPLQAAVTTPMPWGRIP